jgi:hypothetical protein
MTLRGVSGLAALVCAFAVGAAHAQATTEVEPGKGVTVSSEDGNTKLNFTFYGQFRFQG